MDAPLPRTSTKLVLSCLLLLFTAWMVFAKRTSSAPFKTPSWFSSRNRSERVGSGLSSTSPDVHVYLVGKKVMGLASCAQKFLSTASDPHRVLVHCVCVRRKRFASFDERVADVERIAPRTNVRWRLLYDADPSTCLVRCRREWSAMVNETVLPDDATIVFAHGCCAGSGWDWTCRTWQRPSTDGRASALVGFVSAPDLDATEGCFPCVAVVDGKLRVRTHPFARTRIRSQGRTTTWPSVLAGHSWLAMRKEDALRFPFHDGIAAQTEYARKDGFVLCVSSELSLSPWPNQHVGPCSRGVSNVRTSLGTTPSDKCGLSCTDPEHIPEEMIAKYGTVDAATLQLDIAKHGDGGD